MKIDLKELITEFSGNLRLDYDLKKQNWFNIGGTTKAFYKADNLKELIKFLRKIQNLIPKHSHNNPLCLSTPMGKVVVDRFA